MTKHALQIAPDKNHENQIGDRIKIHFANVIRRYGDIGGIGVGHAQTDGNR